MFDLNVLRKIEPKIITVGSYPTVVQSILDFDFFSGKKKPSIKGIFASGRRYERYFYGKQEILIPVFSSIRSCPSQIRESANFLLNLSSGRRVMSSTREIIDNFPSLLMGSIFAEGVPEKHSIDLFRYAESKDVILVGPASVGIVIPQILKLGAIGGIDPKQIKNSEILSGGGIAVLSASGGMVNEIINIVGKSNNRLSFALSFGGDRFPFLEPVEAARAAQDDENTKAIIYYGELGGDDEYKLADLLERGEITKPVICYIAGVVSDLFKIPPQFGHAKAMAVKKEEKAQAKRDALKKAGARVANSFSEFVEMINGLPDIGISPIDLERGKRNNVTIQDMDNRRHALIASSISRDEGGDIKILGEDLMKFANDNSFARIVISLFLGKKIKSLDTEEFVDFVLRVSVDHGPYVSGAINTIITARAGKDLVSSLSAGLLTIGPRFGGAINQAAANWLKGVTKDISVYDFVEDFAKKKIYIQGIGHKKYRVDNPDPRVAKIKEFVDKLENKKFTNFATGVEKITTEKKGNLILNVDGSIAAALLDILSEKEGYSDEELQKLVDTEFFNAIFVLSRSVGFIAHYIDQKRLDEGLLRLEEDDVADASSQ